MKALATAQIDQINLYGYKRFPLMKVFRRTLDGENNDYYANVFAKVYKTLTTDQKLRLAALRKSIMSGTYSDETPFDYSICTTPFLYSGVITNLSLLALYLNNTDYLFFESGRGIISP